MASAEKVRLVRCPKCENLLPELADYSVYQCGGCGAVLRAKPIVQGSDCLSEKSDEERIGGICEKSEILSEKATANLCSSSALDVKSNVGSLSFDCRGLEGNCTVGSDFTNYDSKDTTPNWLVESGLDQNDAGKGFCAQNVSTSGPQRSGKMVDRQTREMGGKVEYPKSMHDNFHGVRLSTSRYPDEGPSNYQLDSRYSHEAPFKKHDDLHEGNRVRYLEGDRAELLRKLDELKDQLARSCDVVDKAKDSFPINRGTVAPDTHAGPNACFPVGSSDLNKNPFGSFDPYRHSAGLAYKSHQQNPLSYTNQPDVMHRFYSSVQNPHHFPGYKDTYASHVHGTAPGEYHRPPPHMFYAREYADPTSDPFRSYNNSGLHQSACRCYHCCDNHREVSTAVPPTAFYNKKFSDVPQHNGLYHHEDPGSLGYHSLNPRLAVPPFISHKPQSHIRQPSDLNYAMGGLLQRQPPRVVLAGSGRRLHPIAGAAPFVACHNCFELLQLPKKVLLMTKKRQKVRCGACSTMISYKVVNKRLIFSDHTEAKEANADCEDSSYEALKEDYVHSHGYVNRDSANFSSDDFDNSGYEFLSMDRKQAPLTTCHNLSLSDSQEMEGLHSTSPSISDDEHSPDDLMGLSDSAQQPINAARSPPPAGSPLQKHFDHSSHNHAVNRFGKGNRSSRSDHEKFLPNKAILRQNSLQEASLATEMEVSFNECSDTGVSQESGDASREHDQTRGNKGNESFFMNIIKKSFKDLSRSNQSDEHGRAKVSINGHPISDRLIRKAEKLAGPIQPGNFWYDYRAGFWGIIGGPCLGIIPPFIEEFNYPMPENCAGGNTGIFVNGRELHEKDLTLLASRGLPTDRDRSYIVEISGRVLDEETGEELDCLGKLAPTVEKVKHGFGMKVPKAADY